MFSQRKNYETHWFLMMFQGDVKKTTFLNLSTFQCRAIEKGHFLKSNHFHGFAFSDCWENITTCVKVFLWKYSRGILSWKYFYTGNIFCEQVFEPFYHHFTFNIAYPGLLLQCTHSYQTRTIVPSCIKLYTIWRRSCMKLYQVVPSCTKLYQVVSTWYKLYNSGCAAAGAGARTSCYMLLQVVWQTYIKYILVVQKCIKLYQVVSIFIKLYEVVWRFGIQLDTTWYNLYILIHIHTTCNNLYKLNLIQLYTTLNNFIQLDLYNVIQLAIPCYTTWYKL